MAIICAYIFLMAIFDTAVIAASFYGFACVLNKYDPEISQSRARTTLLASEANQGTEGGR